MYKTIDDFLTDWSQESALTLKVLEALTDASLTQAVSEAQPRTLGGLAWHLTGGVGGMLEAGGVQIDGPDYKTAAPTSAAELAEAYRKMSDAAAAAIRSQWTDAKLSDKLLLFGFIDTTYAGLLNLVVRHQIHHRGQMTVLMRQAGLAAPGVYGPNQEETAAMAASKSS